jgi:signal transduction histidine kinase
MHLPLEQYLTQVVEILYANLELRNNIAIRIIRDGRVYQREDFEATAHCQKAAMNIRGQSRGTIEIYYQQDPTNASDDKGDSFFSIADRELLDMIAQQVAIIADNCQVRAEKERLEQQIQQVDRLATIGQLAAIVAHELNEPLSSILGFAQLSQKSDGLPDMVMGDLQKIVKACLHAREIVNKLRLFARQMTTTREHTDLNQVIRDGLYFTESQCTKFGINIKRDLDPNLPSIMADPGQMHQVLTNLTVNAMQAMPQGGTMTIRTQCQGKYVCLIVEDTGVGITAEQQSQIFLPFFTTKNANEGTGLGLAIVQSIVTAHNGQIQVESQVQVGSKFIVFLPRYEIE